MTCSDYSSLFYALLVLGCCLSCQPSLPPNHSWAIYKADLESTSYSPLSDINTENVSQLEVAWEFQPTGMPERARFSKYECNPLIIDTVLYATSSNRWLFALHAETGKQMWSFDPFKGGRGGGINRGVSYWEEGEDKRILFTAENFLYAIKAQTGEPITAFGQEGRVNLKIDRGEEPEAWVIPTSPGIIYEDLFIIGGEVSELHGAAPGHIRAFDVRTGELIWTFHTIPKPGEQGYETWPEDAWTYVGGANNWGGMSLDQKRGMVFVPLGSPTYDFYGADRKGKNLFGNCLIALNAKTGKLIWYYQTVHHDIWDYDLPAPPNLVQVEREGKQIDAVAQSTKTGFLFVFDRETGEPLFPIEEREVPPSQIPGEEAWPTQPFPLLPKPYARQDMDLKDLFDPSTQGLDSLRRVLQGLKNGGIFTPPHPQGTLMVPGTRGGSEWGGAAYDPSTGILYLNANESPEIATVQEKAHLESALSLSQYERGEKVYQNYCASCHGLDREGQEPTHPPLLGLDTRLTESETIQKVRLGSGRMPSFSHLSDKQVDAVTAYLFDKMEELDGDEELSAEEEEVASTYLNRTAYSYFRNSSGYPALRPPWGTLNAINLHTGQYEWSIPLGNYPDLQQEGEPPTGTENYGGPIVTAGGLIFIGATKDQTFRAFDKGTGELLWETSLPGNGYASPATYRVNGKQFLVIAVSGNKEQPEGRIVAFSLP